MSAKLEHSNVFLMHTHKREQCVGEYCTIHNRSLHHMRGWPQHWRSDRCIMERINPFGGACPDPDSPWPIGSSNWVHGCVINPVTKLGMCVPWEYKGEPATFLTDDTVITKSGTLLLLDYEDSLVYIGQADKDTLRKYWPEK